MTQAIDLIKHNIRVAVLILVAVVLVIVLYMFYSSSQSVADDHAKVQSQLASARASLSVAQNQYNVATLQQERDSLPTSPSFPTSFPNVQLSAYLASAADNFNVTINVITPQSPAGIETLGGKTYYRYDTAVSVTGAYDAINSFLSRLEGGLFASSVRIQNASFTPSGGTFTLSMLTLS